jgi:hypothetical protein
MNKMLIFSLFFAMSSSLAFSQSTNDCRSIMLDFLSHVQKSETQATLLNDWSINEKKQFLVDIKSLGFSSVDLSIIIESLNLKKESISSDHVLSYLSFVLSLKEKEQKIALMDLEQLDAREINSEYINKFIKHEEKIKAKFESKNLTSPAEQNRYQELYYGCRALRPNDINKGAAKEFKRFNFALGLGTLGASYAYYNMNKEFNAEWFEKLGYDVGVSLIFSYVGGVIQTNANDTQMVKSLKSYYIGRLIGVSDVVVYDPIFNKEHDLALKRIEKLKSDPNYKREVDNLLISYKERGLYRKYKAEIIAALKILPSGISLGVKGKSIDENNIDWNNLTHSDLDRPEVQDIMVAAAMAQVYEQSKGEWIDTSDAGLDRYAFNTIFYGAQIPRSMIQSYITYQMLCMGQDNSKVSFAKAVLFNVSSNFIVNQALYDYRQKAIGH